MKRNNKLRHPSTIKIGDIPTEQPRYIPPNSAYQPKMYKHKYFWMMADEADDRRAAMAQAKREQQVRDVKASGQRIRDGIAAQGEARRETTS